MVPVPRSSGRRLCLMLARESRSGGVHASGRQGCPTDTAKPVSRRPWSESEERERSVRHGPAPTGEEDSQMKRLLLALLTAGTMIVSTAVQAQDHKTLGIVALLANDALNIAVIGGATDAAKAAGWDVKVTDTQASADQANAAMNSFAAQHVDAIFVLAFASSSIGSGLAAARDAHIPVGTWGGEIVPG
ncbi:MAG: sugar ABC transporter substrate-binding protein, partial [Mesorhizobium sp.]